MKRILSLSIAFLLAAGSITTVSAVSYWEGDAEGECSGIGILVDWVGYLSSSAFIGYWNGCLSNDMITDGNSTVTDLGYCIDIEDGYWDSSCESVYMEGTWQGRFYEDATPDTASGSWDHGGGACTGSWAGHLQE